MDGTGAARMLDDRRLSCSSQFSLHRYPMHRRSFLRTLGASATALAFPSIIPSRALGLEGAPSPSNRLTLGFIGTGSQGSFLLGNFLSEPRVQVVALCDVDAERLARAVERVQRHNAEAGQTGAGDGIFTTGDFRELLARPDIDAVVIATPDHWHALVSIHAARAGKHIYMEKPLSLTIPEGRAIVRAVETAGVVCQIGSQQRSSGEFLRVVELARNGFYGEIKSVKVGLPGGAGPLITTPLTGQTVPAGFNYDWWLGPAAWAPYCKERCHWHFRWIMDYSGGQLSDWIGHHLDIATWALGLERTGPVAIRAASATFPTGPLYNTAESYSFEAHYAGGQMVHVASSNRMGIRIEGTEGWTWVSRGQTEFSDARLERAPIPAQGFRADREGTHYANFVDCIHSRKATRCPVAQAHRAASVAHLANLAFRTGRSELKWDPVNERVIDAPDAAALLARAYRAPWQLPV
jgi:predicted dehydrogenase